VIDKTELSDEFAKFAELAARDGIDALERLFREAAEMIADFQKLRKDKHERLRSF
jgi:hypothetical protein